MSVLEADRAEVSPRIEGQRRRRAREREQDGRLRGERPGVRQGVQGLTKRELDVVRAYTDTGSQLGAAARLGISVQTVKNHLGHIFEKLDVVAVGQACVVVDRYLRGDQPPTWPLVDRRMGLDRRRGDRRLRDRRRNA